MTPTRRWALLAALLAPLPALAQPPEGRGQGRGQGGGQGNSGRGGNQGRGGAAGLGAVELNIVQLWLGANPGFVAQPLPPGMQNRLARGKPLPPGIARRTLPPDLLGQLPRKPGHDYALVGASLVLIELATGAVAGLLADALLRR
jgi:hypothetical protein